VGVGDTRRGRHQVIGLHHVQLAMPAGGEEAADRFYAGLLGLDPIPKPANLAGRGGCWFRSAAAEIHLGVEEDFRPARKAHPALLVEGLAALRATLEEAGIEIAGDVPLQGHDRFYVADPFGNRLELIARTL
jgi:catechol 2,3-dioxygenase-like lactoylglutathione lyase family enzyme